MEWSEEEQEQEEDGQAKTNNDIMQEIYVVLVGRGGKEGGTEGGVSVHCTIE